MRRLLVFQNHQPLDAEEDRLQKAMENNPHEVMEFFECLLLKKDENDSSLEEFLAFAKARTTRRERHAK